ncbi:hypothetical protein ACFX19_002520 [Malus domestica]
MGMALQFTLLTGGDSRNSCVSVSENEPRGSFLYQEETWRLTPRRSDSICPASTPALPILPKFMMQLTLQGTEMKLTNEKLLQ